MVSSISSCLRIPACLSWVPTLWTSNLPRQSLQLYKPIPCNKSLIIAIYLLLVLLLWLTSGISFILIETPVKTPALWLIRSVILEKLLNGSEPLLSDLQNEGNNYSIVINKNYSYFIVLELYYFWCFLCNSFCAKYFTCIISFNSL